MTKVLMAAAAALLVSACGVGGGKSVYVAACVKEKQGDQKTCQCIGDKLEKTLDPQMFQAVTLQAEGKAEEADKIISKIPDEKKFTGAMAAAGAAMSCMAGAQ